MPVTHVTVEVPNGLDRIRDPDPAWKDAGVARMDAGVEGQPSTGVRRVATGAGLHERTFLQQTPMGDLVIITLEGDDPGQAFGQLLTGSDAFSKWFGEHAMAAHGDLQLPTTGSPSELVADSEWA